MHLGGAIRAMKPSATTTRRRRRVLHPVASKISNNINVINIKEEAEQQQQRGGKETRT
jgi:hypothetical protein